MASDFPAPQFATPSRPDRPNLLEEHRETADMLGIELMAWQEAFISVATELVDDPEGGDEMVPAYPNLLLSVGRRSGKTFMAYVMALTKMRLVDRCRAFATAQDLRSAALRIGAGSGMPAPSHRHPQGRPRAPSRPL